MPLVLTLSGANVKNINAKTTKGWPRYTTKQRKTMLKKCGKRAFLAPQNLKYPIMSSDCKYDCRGLRVAKQRASMHRPGLKKKIDALGKRLKCRWARAK